MKLSAVSKAIALGVSMAWLAGCSSTGKTTDAGAGQGADSAYGSGVGSQGAIDASAVANVPSVFYFDFDKSDLKAEYRDALAVHAQYINANPSVQVRLEGHTDEWGTREYNMALGERRAKTVEAFLRGQGVDLMRIESISYGEEKPANAASNKDAWSENRRVELKYQ
ncbi:peptidoglycan-associated lipoprotein Pal [Balneatrix alpica]|uniref:Peptidoglycan-associated lipoprotein n=1 Tax=Balneatrix alpica TaxID=75684 RepID=A0ABV5Z6R8_9GAMM|nr:peptidoglycan-associated lipoprotein Pal [Balneatrix alpica]